MEVDLDQDEDLYGPLLRIPPENIVSLARDIALSRGHQGLPAGRLVERLGGAFYLIHIVAFGSFKLVIRLPPLWGKRFTQDAALSLKSEVATLKLVRKVTNIPVAEVYGLDTTTTNKIGAPYICTSFLPGNPLRKLWRERKGDEAFRLNVLKSMASTMKELSAIAFDEIGCIQEDPRSGEFIIGPLFDRDWAEEGFEVTMTGPFNSMDEYFSQLTSFPDGTVGTTLDKANGQIINMLIEYLPHDDGRYVLELPGHDCSNILVDSKGNVTGITDWNLAQTVPGYLGYASYPGWITRDWDPLVYHPEGDIDDPPEALEKYREYYNSQIAKALARDDDLISSAAQYTHKSHIYTSVWIAMHSEMSRTDIIAKIVQTALGGKENGHYHMNWIGDDKYTVYEWNDLVDKLEHLLLPN